MERVGLGDNDVKFLEDEEAVTVALIACQWKDYNDIEQQLQDDYVAFIATLGAPKPKRATFAKFKMLWDLAKAEWDSAIAGIRAPQAAAPSSGAAMGAPAAVPHTTTSKTMPVGELNKRAQAWQLKWTPNRPFNLKAIVGAELQIYTWGVEILEKRMSAKPLGWILKVRTWMADGSSPNKASAQAAAAPQPLVSLPGASAGTTVIGVGSTVQGGLKLTNYQQHLDALESFLWAHRWMDCAAEDELVVWNDWWNNTLRKHGNCFDELYLVAELWDLSQAHIVSDVRGGLSYEASIKRLREDTDWYKEASALYDKKRSERAEQQRQQHQQQRQLAGAGAGPGTPRRDFRGGAGGKGGLGRDRSDPYSPQRKGKGGKDNAPKGKGGKAFNLPPPPPAGGKGGKAPPIPQDHPGRQNWGKADKEGKPFCRNWNTVGCTSRKCQFSHSCARCGSFEHTAIDMVC